MRVYRMSDESRDNAALVFATSAAEAIAVYRKNWGEDPKVFDAFDPLVLVSPNVTFDVVRLGEQTQEESPA